MPLKPHTAEGELHLLCQQSLEAARSRAEKAESDAAAQATALEAAKAVEVELEAMQATVEKVRAEQTALGDRLSRMREGLRADERVRQRVAKAVDLALEILDEAELAAEVEGEGAGA